MIKLDITVDLVCQKCHRNFTVPIISNRRKCCDDCRPAQLKERHVSDARKWRGDNREIYNAYMRDYREEYPEYGQAVVDGRRSRRVDDPEYAAKMSAASLASHNRRKSMLGPDGSLKISTPDWEATLDRFGGRCAYCGTDHHVGQDHFIPVTKGGKSVLGNIVPACTRCNSKKYNRLPQDFLEPNFYYDIVKVLEELSSNPTH